MKNKSCIDEMDELLDQIANFKKLVKSSTDKSDPRFVQEYRLFKQHVEWVSEDLTAGSYIVDHPKNIAKR